MRAIGARALNEVGDIWKQYDVIGIDEGQFFSDVSKNEIIECKYIAQYIYCVMFVLSLAVYLINLHSLLNNKQIIYNQMKIFSIKIWKYITFEGYFFNSNI